jgi:hypothetical protein
MKINKLKVFNKYINEILKPIYPMVSKFDLKYYEEHNKYLLDIYLNDETIRKKNMYEKGMDPHYVLVHLKSFLDYFSPQDRIFIGLRVYSPKGIEVYSNGFFEKI